MGRPTILLADDHQAARTLAAKILSKKYNVICQTEDGLAALAAIKKWRPDIVVMDISMPSMSGIDVTKKISEYANKPRVVFMTVHDNPDFLREAIDAGGLGYVLKHNMATELLEAVAVAALGRIFISPSMFRSPSTLETAN